MKGGFIVSSLILTAEGWIHDDKDLTHERTTKSIKTPADDRNVHKMILAS